MDDKVFKDVFLAPAIAAYQKSSTKRKSEIISDEQVGHSYGTMIRRITYRDPLSILMVFPT